jgi:hypothetical protein
MEKFVLQADRDEPQAAISHGGCMIMSVSEVHGPCTHFHACARTAGRGCMGPFCASARGLVIALSPLCMASCFVCKGLAADW